MYGLTESEENEYIGNCGIGNCGNGNCVRPDPDGERTGDVREELAGT